MTYIQGFVIPVAPGKRDAYRNTAEQAAPWFTKYGALEIVECFEADVPDGKVTDFRRAVAAEPGEKIVFSWIVWPSKEVCDEASRKMMEEGMGSEDEMPFDPKRMIMGGFEPIFRTGRAEIEVARQTEPA